MWGNGIGGDCSGPFMHDDRVTSGFLRGVARCYIWRASPAPGDAAVQILIVEDSSEILANIMDFLGSRGFQCDSARDGITGLHLAATNRYDLIVLDLMLPGIDGTTLCRRLRADAGVFTPIVMLTARDTVADKVTGFEAGADDYLVKPFALAELEARILAVVKRSRNPSGTRELRVADLTLNTATLEVTRALQPIKLTPVGLKILERLMLAAPNIVRRSELVDAVWGEDQHEGDSLRAHIHLLRQAIDKPFDRPLLRTVHRIGYRLADRD